MCTIRCVECDSMVCVMFAALCATLWYVIFSLFFLSVNFSVCTFRCFVYEFIVCVLFAVLCVTLWYG